MSSESAPASEGSLPDLPNLGLPEPLPASPAGWDSFAPPVSAAAPSPAAPIIAEWTRTAGPDQSLALTGKALSAAAAPDAGEDTRFVVFGQTLPGDAFQGDASIQRLDGAKSAITLPAGLPAWSTYLVWPVNGNGPGYPVAVNRTDAWWLSANQAAPGQTLAVYGRNLSHSGGTAQSWVYVTQPGTAGQWASVTSVNPYRVEFALPATLSAGACQVWVHNGHGGKYGWSGPLALAVAPAHVWDGSQFNVRDYGATGDGSTDDSDAIQRALNAAMAYRNASGLSPTVYLPSGVYLIRYGFGLDYDLRLLGDGIGQTILRCSAAFPQPPGAGDGSKAGMIRESGSPGHDLALVGMTFDASGNFTAAANGGCVLNMTTPGVTDVTLTNVAVISLISGVGCAQFSAPHRLTFEGCQFTGGEVFLVQGSEEAFDHCIFAQAQYQEAAVHELSNSDFSITDCTSQDYAPGSQAGQGQGRLVAGSAWFGAQYHAYIAGNVTSGLGPVPGDNMGEQILCEGSVNSNAGSPATATATTVTVAAWAASPGDYTGQMAVICAGAGMGQVRRISGCDAGTNTITVTPAWNVVPDATSTILIESGTSRWVAYQNQLQGKPFYATAYSAMTGVEPFGGCYEWIADSNTLSNLRYGFYVAAISQTGPVADINPCYFNLFANNSITDCSLGVGVVCGFPSSGQDPGVGCFGNMFRGNTFTNMATAGAVENSIPPGGAPGTPLDLTVFEHNAFSDLPAGIDCDPQSAGTRSQNTLLYANSFAAGAAAGADTFGIHTTAGTIAPGLRLNSWSSFASAYASDSGPTLELPQRVLMPSAGAGDVSQIALAVWNSGMQPLAWSAASDASWLTLTPAAGSVADENSMASVTVQASAAALNPGTYAGTVTFSSGNQSKSVLVEFTVTPPPRHLARVVCHTIVAQ